MELQYWHLAVVVALLALVVWGIRVARQTTLAALAATSMIVSSFLYYTLVVDEEYLQSDLNSRLDKVALIGIPAALAVVFGVSALRRSRRERA